MHYLFLCIAHCRVDKYNCNNANDDYICFEILCSMSEDKKKHIMYVIDIIINELHMEPILLYFSFFLTCIQDSHFLCVF